MNKRNRHFKVFYLLPNTAILSKHLQYIDGAF